MSFKNQRKSYNTLYTNTLQVGLHYNYNDIKLALCFYQISQCDPA